MSRRTYPGLAPNQAVPESLAQELRRMRANHDDRFGATLDSANRYGWTLAALGAAVGFSGEAIRVRLTKPYTPYPTSALPHIPLPVRRPDPEPRPSRLRLLIDEETADRLREMWVVARAVTGGTPVDSPKRRLSEQFTAKIAELVEQGVTVYQIAQTLGCAVSGVYLRLGRHGYRPLPPSQAATVYRNVEASQLRRYKRRPMTPDDERHGKPAGYRAGCHCQPCRDAANAQKRRAYARRIGKLTPHDIQEGTAP